MWNAWLFMIIFLLQWIAVLFIPKQIADRTGHPRELKLTRKGEIMARVTEIFWIGAMLYSIFLPLRIGTAWFYCGLGVFVIGAIMLVSATWIVVKTPLDRPFTTGVYRFSRHPMYLSMILVYMGVSVASASWLFLLITTITFFLQRFQMMQEEEFCCEKFGQAYLTYKKRTPRWMGMPKENCYRLPT
jgi:protein-S-isoprenylcysteine O-methyltransferase Ste14